MIANFGIGYLVSVATHCVDLVKSATHCIASKLRQTEEHECEVIYLEFEEPVREAA